VSQDPLTLTMLFAVFVLAGTIKGTLGIGLPTVAIALMSQFLDPMLAISLTLLPILLTNVWQCYRSGRAYQTIVHFLPYLSCMVIFIYLAANLAQGISARTLVLSLGAAVVVFSITNLSFTPPRIPDRFDRLGQIIAGTMSGLMGGFTAIWGPPMIIFLLARRTSKDDFVRATGTLLAAGSVPLFMSYWRAGHVDGPIALLSAVLIVPALFGFLIGERLRARLDPDRFQTAVLIMFLFLGLNLIRRGLSL